MLLKEGFLTNANLGVEKFQKGIRLSERFVCYLIKDHC